MTMRSTLFALAAGLGMGFGEINRAAPLSMRYGRSVNVTKRTGKHNPPGTKLLRKAQKGTLGVKSGPGSLRPRMNGRFPFSDSKR